MTDKFLDKLISSPPDHLKCKNVVVGSGPGGAITACLLAEAGEDVLMIEEGPFLAPGQCEPFSTDEMTLKYRNGGLTPALGKTKIAYVEGRCVGGGSEVNAALYHRLPSEITVQWQQEYEIEYFNENVLDSHYNACESDVSVSFMPGQFPAASLKLKEGADKLGWIAIEVPRCYRYLNSGVKGQPLGIRQSMMETYIPRALNAGCQVMSDARIHKIKREGSSWALGGCFNKSRKIEIRAENLWLACGAIQTPALLLRSGIKQNIGNSLSLHPTIKVVAKFDTEINSKGMGIPVHQVKEFAPKYSFGCSISSPPYLAIIMNDYPQHTADVVYEWKNMAVYYAMIAAEGCGNVRPLPWFNDPLVRYKLTLNDMKLLAEALKNLSLLLLSAGALSIFPSVATMDKISNLEGIEKIPHRLPDALTNLMTIHLFSSCPMGENKTKCAADSFGRVHGLQNLFIADASLLCTAPTVNPQGAIMAIVRRNIFKHLGKL